VPNEGTLKGKYKLSESNDSQRSVTYRRHFKIERLKRARILAMEY